MLDVFLFEILYNQPLNVLAARGVEDTKGRDWWEASASNASTNGVAWSANSTSRNATSRPGERGVTAAFGRLGDRVRQSGIRSSRSIYLYPKTRQNSLHLFVYTRPT